MRRGRGNAQLVRERGASSLEYLGGILVAAVLVGGVSVAATGTGPQITAAVTCTFNKITNADATGCSSGGGQEQGETSQPGSAVEPGSTADRRDAEREVRGNRRDDARRREDGTPTGTPTGTEGSALPTGLGDPVPGTQVPTPQPPPWQPVDEGAGEHGSKNPSAKDRVTVLAAETAANAMAGTWPHASRNLLHFLGNTGEPLKQDVDALLQDVPELADQARLERENFAGTAVERARQDGVTGPVTYPLSTAWSSYYIGEPPDWFYALGGIQYSQVGQVTVYPPDTPGGQWRYEVTSTLVLRDQYNWDGGKSTQIGPFTVTDEQLAELHRAGLASEFTATGKSGTQTTTGSVP